MVGDTVHAGFPSPAEDFAVERLDLTTILVTHPQATFIVRLRGDSMREAGIFDGDLLVVNRALKPIHTDVVLAVVRWLGVPWWQCGHSCAGRYSQVSQKTVYS